MASYNWPPSGGSGTWKDPVDTSSSLPLVGNTLGDARVVEDSDSIYIWDGSSWIQTGGGGGGSLATLSDVEPGLLYTSGFVLQGNGTKYTGAQLNFSQLAGHATVAQGGLDLTAVVANGKFLQSDGVGYVGTDAVDLTTDQSISGIKTFASFPVLPSSNPTLAQQAVNKQYVDTVATTGQRFVAACDAATTANITATYSNGASGVGATLTGVGNGALPTQDGVASVANLVYLVKSQSTGFQNGAYILSTLGDGSNPFVLTRLTGYDQTSEIVAGTFFSVLGGTVNANTQWAMTTTGTVTVGATAVVFQQLSASATYSASLGVQLVGNDFRADLVSSHGLALVGNSLQVDYDDSTIGMVTGKMAVKVNGITNNRIADVAATKVTGNMTVAQGGTNITTYTTGDTLYASGSNVLSKRTAGTDGQIYTMASGVPTWATSVGNSGTATINYAKSLDTSVSTASVSNSVAETTMYTVSIPANTLSTNKLIKVVVQGTWLNTGASNAVTLRLKYGSTTLFPLGSASIVANASPGSFSSTFYLAGSGATNAQTAYGIIQPTGGSGAAPTTTSKSGVSAEDSTTTLNLVITAQLSVATATTTFTKTFATTSLENATDTIGAPTDAQYVTLATNSSLSNERVLTGTANQIVVTDNGAGSTVVLSTPQNIATASSPQFAGIELGNASDTTLSRSSAGVLAVEGVVIPSISSNNALTNKTYNGLTVTTTTGTLTLANSSTLATSGAFAITLTSTGTTGVTLPTTGTLATLAGSEAFTNKTYNGLTVTTTTGTLTLANSSTLATSGGNSITLTSTGSTNVTLPTTGTLATLAGSEALTNKSLNGMTVTASTGTFTLTNAKVFSVAKSIALDGTDSTTITCPSTSQTLVGRTSTDTLTNKRVTKRINSASAANSLTPNADNYDMEIITLSSGTAFTLSNPTGTPTDGQMMEFKIKATASGAFTYTFGNQFRFSVSLAQPTTSGGTSKFDKLVAQWDAGDSKWDLVGYVAGF